MKNIDIRSMHRIGDIEVLRAVAVIIVIMGHLQPLLFWIEDPLRPLTKYLAFWGGVDLFFAISGFVIMKDIYSGLLTRLADPVEYWRFTLAFWTRRAWRLIPSAWLWVIIPLVGSFLFPPNFGAPDDNFAAGLSAVLQVANLHLWNVERWGHHPGILGVYWSLSLEEQFYILLPVFILLCNRFLGSIVIVLALGQTLLPEQLWTATANLPWVIRTEAILLGVLIAMWTYEASYKLFEPTFLRRTYCSIPAVTFLVLCVMAVPSNAGKISLIPFDIGLLALISAVLVFIASFNKDYIMPECRLKTLLIWIGQRSYALYLVHLPAFEVSKILLGITSGNSFSQKQILTLCFTATCLTLTLADLNFRLLEQPLRRKGKSISNKMLSKVEIN